MKKVGIISLLMAFALLLVGCGEVELAVFESAEEIGNGVYAVIAEKTDENYEWYCTADSLTQSILSVNLIYPEKYGEPTKTECVSDGKKISCSLQTGEQEGKRVVFFTLAASYNSLDCEKEIVITQKFGRKKVKFRFIPKSVADQLENV